jgi:hypothetical protein
MALGDVTPEDLAVAQPQRLGVGVLVDQVGDAVVDRGRELDQRVGVEGPGDGQRRPQVFERLGQVLGPLRRAAEERPVGFGATGRLLESSAPMKDSGCRTSDRPT